MKIDKKKIVQLISQINFQYVTIGIIIIVLSIAMGNKSPYFFSLANFHVMIDTFIMEAIMALGMTMVIISGGIDLAIAGILPFSAIMLAVMMRAGLPLPLAIAGVLLLATGIGYISNTLRRVLHLHPMVVTMAIAAILKGLNLTITGGTAISDFPESFHKWSTFTILGMPLSWLIYIVLALFFVFFSKNNKSFLQVYFVGGNEEGAKLSGINVEKVYRNTYILSALLAALAGILTAMTYSSASYSYGTNADLRVITTVAIGGTSLTHGGEGSIVGTILGTLFMAVIYNAFIMSGMSTYYQDVMTGLFLILAVLLSEFLRWVKVKNN